MIPAAHRTSHARRALVVVAVALLAAAAAGAADASAPGAHARRAGFTIVGRLTGRLAPGAGVPIDLRLTNRSRFPLRVTRLAVSVRAVTAPASCGARANFRARAFRGRYPIALPAGRSRTLAQLGYPAGRWPRIEMLETGKDQDACAGARITLAYSGTARRGR